MELILGDIDSHVKEMKISELSLSYVVCGEANNMAAVKINILRDLTVSIPYLVPTQFQELIFSLITSPQIPALS